jgi:cupin fold WbuC family metalloprotein
MLHSMINVILKNSYICPHKHWVEDWKNIIKKWESYFILEGKWKLLFFDDDWKIEKSIILDAKEKSMVLVPEWVWHSIISISEYIIIFENKTGPWKKWKDKIFHKNFPLEWEKWVENILKKWYV